VALEYLSGASPDRGTARCSRGCSSPPNGTSATSRGRARPPTRRGSPNRS